MEKRRQRLLLVGWDSADWKIIHPLLDSGELPGLARLVESGTSGNLTTLEPQLSPMLWTSIATGKMAYHHGVPGFTEVDPGTGAVVLVSAATQTRNVMAVYDRAVDEDRPAVHALPSAAAGGSPRPTSISLPGRGAAGFLVVSGFPRSGTSLMLQILRAGA